MSKAFIEYSLHDYIRIQVETGLIFILIPKPMQLAISIILDREKSPLLPESIVLVAFNAA